MPRSTPAQTAHAPSHEPLVLALSDVIGEGADAHRVARVGRWTLEAHNDDTLRMRDADIAAALGYAQARDVRKLITRIWPENKRPRVRATVARTQMPTGGVREKVVNEYWLTEAELLKLCARSEAPVAEAILDEMIQVYMLVRRGLLRPAAAPATLSPEMAAMLTTVAAQVETLAVLMRESTARLDSIEREVASGVVGRARGEEITKRLYAASLRATANDKALARSVRGRWTQTIRNAAQFNGPRSRWCNLPRAALAVVEAHLDAIEREADLMARTAVATAAKAKQGTLPLN